MKKYILEFCKRGLMAAWGGPVILAVVYLALGAAGVIRTLSPAEVCKGILTVSLMAFIAGGVSVVYHIDRLPLTGAILIHSVILYLDYILIYLWNGWLKQDMTPILIFTVIFAVGYAFIWLMIYFSTRNNIEKLNRQLKDS